MPYFLWIDYIPWLGSTVAECLLLGIMLRRNLVRRFPIFFISVAFDLLREFTLPAVGYHSELAYRYGYWLSLPVEYVIGFAVMMEAYGSLRATHAKIPAKTLRALALAALVLIGLAVLLVLYPDIPITNLQGFLLTLDRSIDLLRCGVLLFLWAFSSQLGISWRHHISGIVCGLAIYAAMGLLEGAIHATTGTVTGDWAARLPRFAYFAATILWTVYLWKPEPVRKPPTLEELSLATQLIRRYRWMLAQLWRLFLNDDRP